MAVEVRRIRPTDADVLMEMRIAALSDSPSAFGSTLERELAFPAEEWQERARHASNGPDRAMFLAEEDDRVVGIVGGLRECPSQSQVELVSMWIAPSHRRLGLGRKLVDEVVRWARDGGVSTVGLWVTQGNTPAERLYRSLGFDDTDQFQPLPSDPCKHERRMELRV